MNKNQTIVNSDITPARKPKMDIVFKKKIRTADLLNLWKRKLASAEKKVRKYRTAKRQYTQKLNILSTR